jgi:hypothetical protein
MASQSARYASAQFYNLSAMRYKMGREAYLDFWFFDNFGGRQPS